MIFIIKIDFLLFFGMNVLYCIKFLWESNLYFSLFLLVVFLIILVV